MLRDEAATLASLGVSAGSVFIVETLRHSSSFSSSEPSKGANLHSLHSNEDEEAEFDDNFGISASQGPTTEESLKMIPSLNKGNKNVVKVSTQQPSQRSNPTSKRPRAVVSGDYNDSHASSVDMKTLLRCFLSPETSFSTEAELGQMAFTMFASAARLSALEHSNGGQQGSGSFTIELVMKAAKTSAEEERRSKENSNNDDSNNDSKNMRRSESLYPTLKVSYTSNRKLYQDICRLYCEEDIKQLIRMVFATTVTRTRRSPLPCRRLFEVKELCSRAPYILWSVAFRMNLHFE